MKNYWISKKRSRAVSHTIQVLKSGKLLYESAIVVKNMGPDQLGLFDKNIAFATIDRNLIQLIKSYPKTNIPTKLSDIDMVIISFGAASKRISKTTLSDIILEYYHQNSAGILSVLISSPDVPYVSIIP